METSQVLTTPADQPMQDSQPPSPSESQPAVDENLQDLREQERAKRDREQKLRIALEERERELAEFRKAKEEIQLNGWDIDDLRRFSRNGGAKELDPVVKQLNEKLAALEAKSHRLEQERADREELREIEKTISRKSSDFELIKVFGVEAEVQKYIKDHFARTKILLPIEEAARHIEEQIEKFESEKVSKLQSTQKAKRLYSSLIEDKATQKRMDEKVPDRRATPEVSEQRKVEVSAGKHPGIPKFKDPSEEQNYLNQLNDRDRKAYLLKKYS